MAAIEAWGTPALLIVPSGYHRMDAPRFKARYPDLQVICPKASRRRVAQAIEPEGHFDALPQDPTVTCETLDGVRLGEGVFIVRSGERVTLVFNDALFNHPHASGFKGRIGRMVGSTGDARVTAIMRYFAVSDRAALKAHFLRLADLPGLHRLVPGHGDLIETDAAKTLRTVANKL